MEIPEFLVGSEEKFEEFISRLGKKDKTALISHIDLDGFAAAKVVDTAVKSDFMFFINYHEMNDVLLGKLKKLKVNKIIMTDLSIDDVSFIKKAEKFAEILIIDHHQFAEDLNSRRTTFLVAYEYCAAYLSYYLFSKKNRLEELDWLVACASRADFMFSKNAKWIESVVKKYGENIGDFSTENLGKFNYIKDKIGFTIMYWKTKKAINKAYEAIPNEFGSNSLLEKYSAKVEAEVRETLVNFESGKKRINRRLVWIFNPKYKIGSIISNLLSTRHKNQTVLIIRPHDDKYGISARRQDREEDMNKLLKKLVEGLKDASAGGHVPAAGGYFLKKDLKIVMERLEKV